MGRSACPTQLKEDMRLKLSGSIPGTTHKRFFQIWITILLVMAWSIAIQTNVGHARLTANALTIQNDSGQFVLVKIVGPTRAVIKIPLDQTKKVHLAPGEYYILVRFGFAPKEYIYTKGEPFMVTQEKDNFSRTIITLHRVISGIGNPHEVSGEEFKHYKILKGKKKRSQEGQH